MAILEQIRAKFTGQSRAAKLSYDQLVRSIVDGGKVDEEEAGELLNDLGRHPDDLERDVERLRTRFELASSLTEARQADAALPETQEAIRREAAELEAAIAKVRKPFDERLTKLRKEADRLGMLAVNVMRFESKLLESIPRELAEKIEGLEKQRREIRSSITAIEDYKAGLQKTLDTYQRQWDGLEVWNRKIPPFCDYPRSIEYQQERIAEQDRRIADLQAKHDELVPQFTALRAQALIP